MNSKILITGATGFIGSCLARRFCNLGVETHITTRSHSNLWRIKNLPQKPIIHSLNLNEPEEIKHLVRMISPDYVFHLACYGGFSQENDQLLTIQTNLLATHHLLEVCNEAQVKHFIYTGSSSEYGIHLGALTEENREQPTNIYGISKLGATHLTRWYGQETHLRTTIVRVFSPYGPYDDPRRLIPSAICASLFSKNLDLGSGMQVRDYIYIEDLIDAYLLCLTKAPGKGEIINLGSGIQYSIKEVVETILNALGNSIQAQWNRLPDRKNEPKTWRADISQAKTILQWEPQTNLTLGLNKTIKWLKQRLHLYESI